MNRPRRYLNFLLFALMLLAWCIMAFRYTGDSLTAAGIASMKFFTVLSNVFRGFTGLVIALSLRRHPMSRGLDLLNYAATCSVGLTFLVVVAFFGPLYGYTLMFKGGNLFFHLIIPVLAMAEFILFNERPLKMPLLLIAAVPPLIYGFAYLINLLVNGIGYGPNSNDWYGFAIWGIPVGMGIFAVICIASVLIGIVLSLLNRGVSSRRKSL